MDRVLKRVGLSRRSLTVDTKTPSSQAEENVDEGATKQQRRRRRSKSRRRVAGAHHLPSGDGSVSSKKAQKTRGLFNIDWDSVRDCKSCKSRALTKRFCGKKSDNELYRSNSFKFERFVRGNDDVSTLGKKISLCDDYSLPLDHLNKQRPNSIAVPSASEWNISSPNEEKVEVLETYSTPRDSKQHLSEEEDAEQKCFTSPDREYSQPYTTDASSGPSSDEEFFGHKITLTKAPQIELNSPDSISEAILPLVNVQSPVRTDIKRHPSPYYYSDLLKPRVAESPSKPTTSKLQQRSQQLLHSETIFSTKSECHPARNRFATERQQHFQTSGAEKASRKNQKSWSGYHKKYRKSADNCNLERANRSNAHSNKQAGKLQHTAVSSFDDANAVVDVAKFTGDRLGSPCLISGDDALGDIDMTRQRHVYETAFDCRVSKSDDDLDQIDKVSNHSLLSQLESNKHQSTLEGRRKSGYQSSASLQQHAKSTPSDHTSISGLSQKLEKMHIPQEASCAIAALPLRGYTPSPPSTAPLPTKFHGKELIMNSIRSAPNLPSHSKARLKNLHLPIKSLRVGCSPTSSSSAFDIQQHPKTNKFVSGTMEPRPDKDNRVLEIKDRPRKDLFLFKRSKDGKGTILEFKGRRRRHKYSSTESMTTSSSGGSMESIKSSTSEGNRSSTSTESRNSSSMSSHDSDSGAASNYLGAQSGFHGTTNKLHILSPISDKSSQEPVSEISDNNRNNNSQKCSPEEMTVVETTLTTKSRRRLPQNKNLLNLGLHGDPEIQGSDSGISIQSREGVKSRFGLTAELSAPSQADFSDLPFDMPKLRRRRLAAQEAACTSSSATSIDFGDLPFDMPKLRRRLRVQQTSKELSVSQASSSQSVVDPDSQASTFRPKLSLNLSDPSAAKQKPGLGLALTGIGFNSAKSPTSSHDIIDINLPLEKQGWYHGAITRVEAETVLRLLREGSYLVRNSESTRQDYSLSLKSARGFMHMRIQRDETNGTRSYILGQFSKPFGSIPEMIRHFSKNGLPIRGAEHMCLIQPVIAQML